MYKKLKRTYNKWRKFARAHKTGLAVISIVLLAAFFRFWRLNSLPPGLHPDEAANGLDIFRIQAGDIRPLYATNGPREALFFYLQALFVAIFGNTILALRIAPALIGTTAVFTTYLLCKEWFSRRTALLAAFIMASAPWAVTMSRNGFRASMIPLMIPLTLWLYTKALRENTWKWYILTGLSLGAGFYTYLSFRIVPFIAILVALHSLVFYRTAFLAQFKRLLVIGLITFVTLLPMVIFGISHPADVIGGRSSVSFMNPELNQGEPAKTFLLTLGKTALMFNFAGDENYRHNLGGEPMLNFFIGIMFVLGLGLALTRFKNIRYFTLLAIFGGMLIPEVLTAEGIPHGLRAIGVIPAVYIFAAIGITELLARWRAIFPVNPAVRNIGLVFILGLLGMSTLSNYQRYFTAWANAPQTFDAYSEDVVAIADYINTTPYAGKRYLVVDGYSIKTVEYLARGRTEFTRLDPHELPSLDGAEEPFELIIAATQAGSSQPYLQVRPAIEFVRSYDSVNRVGVELFKIYRLKEE